MKKFLKEGEVAERYGLNVRWLQADRQRDRRLPFVKIGRQVFYNADTIDAAINELFSIGGESNPSAKRPKTVRRVANLKRGA